MRSDAYANGRYQSNQPTLLGTLGQQVRRVTNRWSQMPRELIIGIVLLTALLAFEVFNFDTTQFALNNLLGDVRFIGIGWATILAIAFCAIDFAGLVRMFTPERGRDEPKEVWYLMGAWLLGATMNALMTWWAISLTLLDNNLGNEILTREQILKYAPVFVAILVWLTRILFIGALSVTGEHFFAQYRDRRAQQSRANGRVVAAPAYESTSDALPAFMGQQQATQVAATQGGTSKKSRQAPAKRVPNTSAPKSPQPLPKRQPARKNGGNLRQRPPMPKPNGGRNRRPVAASGRQAQASPTNSKDS